MSTANPGPPPARVERPLIVDLIRAYEGILLGLVIVIVAAVLSGGNAGLWDFAVVIVLPGALMVAFMHLGAPPRRLFFLRAAGALAGWGLIWIVFIPLFLILYYAVFPAAALILVFMILAIVDGIILGLSMAAIDRLGRRFRRAVPAEE